MKNIKRGVIVSATYLLLLSCKGSSQPYKYKITGNIKNDVIEMLARNEVEVDILDSIKMDPKQLLLMQKFQVAVKENYEWFMNETQKLKPGERMPYHPNLGLTEEEYRQVENGMNQIELLSTGKEKIEIYDEGGIYKFRSHNKLEIYNYIIVEVNRNIVIINDKELTIRDTVEVADPNNALKSKWKGYTWKYQDPIELTAKTLEDVAELNAISYAFTLGVLEKSQKAFLKIKCQEYKDGKQIMNIEIPVVFN